MSKKKKTKKEDSFIYILLLSVVSVLFVALDNYISLLGIIVLPFILFIINYIYKNYGYKESIKSLSISILIIISYLLLMYNLENRVINFIEVLKISFKYFIVVFLYVLMCKIKKNED